MLIINEIRANKLEYALKALRKKIEKTKQVEELRNRKTYEKPSTKRREKLNKAKYVQQKFGDSKY